MNIIESRLRIARCGLKAIHHIIRVSGYLDKLKRNKIFAITLIKFTCLYTERDQGLYFRPFIK